MTTPGTGMPATTILDMVSKRVLTVTIPEPVGQLSISSSHDFLPASRARVGPRYPRGILARRFGKSFDTTTDLASAGTIPLICPVLVHFSPRSVYRCDIPNVQWVFW
jgi:hypothetical protein